MKIILTVPADLVSAMGGDTIERTYTVCPCDGYLSWHKRDGSIYPSHCLSALLSEIDPGREFSVEFLTEIVQEFDCEDV